MLNTRSNGRPFEEIEYYAEKITSLGKRFSLYIDLQRWGRAAETAALARDVGKLSEVLQLCNDSNLQSRIREIICKLR